MYALAEFFQSKKMLTLVHIEIAVRSHNTC